MAVIQVFCIFILLAGVTIVYQPSAVIDAIHKHRNSKVVYAAAIIARMLFGAVFLAVASDARQPMIFQIIGVLFVLAALVFAIIGQQRFIALLNWACSLTTTIARFMGIFAIAFALALYSFT